MIRTLMSVSWSTLKRDRGALFLTFVLPVVFFSIFAMIFANMGGGGGDAELRPMDVIAVDLDRTDVSRSLLDTLSGQDALDVRKGIEADSPSLRDRDEALRAVRTGKADAAVVVHKGFGDTYGTFVQAPEVELIYDASNPMAQHTIAGLLQASSFSAAPGHLMRTGMSLLEAASGPLTEAQREAIDSFESLIDSQNEAASTDGGTTGDGGDSSGSAMGLMQGLVDVKATAARAESDGSITSASIISYYAAGIGVMFLLFSVTGAASGLLEEEETGTLERLLVSNVDMGALLTSNWAFFTLMGIAQVIVMFVWGAVVFGLDLFTTKHLVGFAAMTLVTASAASAFALVLATLCKTRAQLNGTSTIVILIMSAVGGSMIPRFTMPAFMDTASKFTFNGWALDGYLKVFWYDDPSESTLQALIGLWPQLLVLGALTAVFLGAARFFGRRWESA